MSSGAGGQVGQEPYAVGDDVRMAMETSLRVPVIGLVACKIPDDESLVSAARQEHVRAAMAPS